MNFSLRTGAASGIVNGDDKPTRRTERSRRTAPLGAGDPARPDSGGPQAPPAGPALRPLDGEGPAPCAARSAQGLVHLRTHQPERRLGLRPRLERDPPPAPCARRTRLAAARHAQQGHAPFGQPRARPPSRAARPRPAPAPAHPIAPRIRRQNPASRGDDSRPHSGRSRNYLPPQT